MCSGMMFSLLSSPATLPESSKSSAEKYSPKAANRITHSSSTLGVGKQQFFKVFWNRSYGKTRPASLGAEGSSSLFLAWPRCWTAFLYFWMELIPSASACLARSPPIKERTALRELSTVIAGLPPSIATAPPFRIVSMTNVMRLLRVLSAGREAFKFGCTCAKTNSMERSKMRSFARWNREEDGTNSRVVFCSALGWGLDVDDVEASMSDFLSGTTSFAAGISAFTGSSLTCSTGEGVSSSSSTRFVFLLAALVLLFAFVVFDFVSASSSFSLFSFSFSSSESLTLRTLLNLLLAAGLIGLSSTGFSSSSSDSCAFFD
mmetsp:Transcript_14755/g.20558  ORF Transcript_14755/g.20558 Transcript_14755/m.20558 type:complete len:318 (-) Transcript_14755:159-1112(-)